MDGIPCNRVLANDNSKENKYSQASLLNRIMTHRDPVGDADAIVIGLCERSCQSGTLYVSDSHDGSLSRILKKLMPSLCRCRCLPSRVDTLQSTPDGTSNIIFKMDFVVLTLDMRPNLQ